MFSLFTGSYMKLIICERCDDVVKLSTKEWRSCECGASGGRYMDDLNAEIWGSCQAIGFSNPSLVDALKRQPETGWGVVFEAFVIPRIVPTIRRRDSPSP